MLNLGLTIALLAAEPAIVVVGYPWAPFISPMGEPFRPTRDGRDTLARWFDQADTDKNGALTVSEMRADADRFFAKLDTSGDGQIEPEELTVYEWEVAPEIQVNSKWRRSRDEPDSADKEKRGHFKMAGMDDCLQGAARYSLLNMPQPVAAADSDFNRAITRDEFRDAAAARFRLLDSTKAGGITLASLQPFVPKLTSKCRVKRDEKANDARVGVPLPQGN